jgi:hypothetical protein
MDIENSGAKDDGSESVASARIVDSMSDKNSETEEIDTSAAGVSESADVQERLRRADALRSAQRALELADQLKLVSLNVAIESAKTRSSSVDLKRVKSDLSTLTNQAVRASREIGGMINAISSGEPIVSSVESDFRKAVKLKKELESILSQSERVLESIDRLESR